MTIKKYYYVCGLILLFGLTFASLQSATAQCIDKTRQSETGKIKMSAQSKEDKKTSNLALGAGLSVGVSTAALCSLLYAFRGKFQGKSGEPKGVVDPGRASVADGGLDGGGPGSQGLVRRGALNIVILPEGKREDFFMNHKKLFQENHVAVLLWEIRPRLHNVGCLDLLYDEGVDFEECGNLGEIYRNAVRIAAKDGCKQIFMAPPQDQFGDSNDFVNDFVLSRLAKADPAIDAEWAAFLRSNENLDIFYVMDSMLSGQIIDGSAFGLIQAMLDAYTTPHLDRSSNICSTGQGCVIKLTKCDCAKPCDCNANVVYIMSSRAQKMLRFVAHPKIDQAQWLRYFITDPCEFLRSRIYTSDLVSSSTDSENWGKHDPWQYYGYCWVPQQ